MTESFCNRERQEILCSQQKAAIRHTRSDREPALILLRATHGLKCCQPSSMSEATGMMTHFDRAAYESYYAGNPDLGHLMAPTKNNVLRAFIQNFTLLGIPLQQIDDGILSSPTLVQIHVPLHPWLDCFTFPQIRDNLVRAAELFNDCDICTDIMDLANGDIGMIVWGGPWVPQNWEISELFIRKWSAGIKGCPEIILSNNFWRARRGLDGLDQGGMPFLVDLYIQEYSEME
ncbi:hypothetical protein BDW71DRAFT_194412 [Aspergillus fruticulosus]